ncbi:MAG: hypothetical protein J5833_07985 [Victivallales bacterium]|nr:hypothetical protein [Victivallales bacterium]
MIESVQIATNRYAPDGAQAINMYRMDGEPLTIGQLIAAVCIKAGANMEAQTILKVNTMNGNTETIKTASDYLQQLADGTVSNWNTVKSFLTNTLGVAASDLPDNVSSYANRMKAINAMKVKLEALTRQAQEDMIDVQSLINKRDVAYSTCTSLVKETGSSSNNIALQF